MSEKRRRRRPRRPGSQRGSGSTPPESPDAGAGRDPAPEEDGGSVSGEAIVEPEDGLPAATLQELPDSLAEACRRAGWSSLMPVQARTIPYVLADRDLMVQSRTGSGKTGAFLLPLLQRIDARRPATQALILVPTRELAQQVEHEAERLAPREIRTVAVYGGVGYGKQLQAFREGAHLAVGTPGRVLDHLLQGNLQLGELRFLVFDEADRMLSMGFYPDMKRVKSYLPDGLRATYMFSATYPYHVLRLAGEFMRSADMLSLSKDSIHVTNVEHLAYLVPDVNKDRVLVRLIELENPAAAVIFCNTKAEVTYVNLVLQRFGYDSLALSSELDQKKRDKVLTKLRNGKLKFLVSTDVAARGIDIPEISHVFQYDVPEDTEDYVHRAGRTGRAGAGGKAITLLYAMDKVRLGHIRDAYGIDLEIREAPSDEDVAQVVTERVTALLEAKLRSKGPLERERMQRFVPLGRHLADNEDESALIAMLLDDYYQTSLHMPLVEDTGTETAGSDAEMGSRRRKRRTARSRSGRRRA